MKLVYHNGTIGEIYFPVGKLKDGGTCQFATKKCINECGLESNEVIDYVYKFFKTKSSGEICEHILKDLFYFPRKVLSWFASGDCPTILEKKVLKVMKGLSYQNIHQNGFTRNKSLWKKALSISYMNLALTVNTKKEALKIKEKGLVAVPQFACWKVDIYNIVKQQYGKRIEYIGGCGGGWFEYKTRMGRKKVSVEDCGICYDKSIGCFKRIRR